MQKKIIRIIIGFLVVMAGLILTSVVLELAGYSNVMYNIGYGIGHFVRGIINLF